MPQCVLTKRYDYDIIIEVAAQFERQPRKRKRERRVRMEIVFVCHGNYCRSPMAEFIMKDKLAQAGITDVHVFSRALHRDEIGSDMYGKAKQTLAAHGVPFSRHTATLMTEDDYAKADAVVVMDTYNFRDATRRYGNEKVFLLRQAEGLADDVDDPWYTRDFERTYREIDSAADALTAQLKRGVRTAEELFGK